MLRDVGSWHHEFNAIVSEIREKLLRWPACRARPVGRQCYSRAAAHSASRPCFRRAPADGKVARRRQRSVRRADGTDARTREDRPRRMARLRKTLRRSDVVEAASPMNGAMTHVAVVHCETTTGILNPIDAIGPWSSGTNGVHRRRHEQLRRNPDRFRRERRRFSRLVGEQVHRRRARLFVRDMPARRSTRVRGFARSLSLDLLGQLQGLREERAVPFYSAYPRAARVRSGAEVSSRPRAACEGGTRGTGQPRGARRRHVGARIRGLSRAGCTELHHHGIRLSVERRVRLRTLL